MENEILFSQRHLRLPPTRCDLSAIGFRLQIIGKLTLNKSISDQTEQLIQVAIYKERILH